jgi:hypothetical protein
MRNFHLLVFLNQAVFLLPVCSSLQTHSVEQDNVSMIINKKNPPSWRVSLLASRVNSTIQGRIATNLLARVIASTFSVIHIFQPKEYGKNNGILSHD